MLLASSVGCGLLVRRIAGGDLSSLLLTPVGFALVVAICAFATSYGWLAPAAGPIAVVTALVGYVLEARSRSPSMPRLHSGPWLWPVIAAVVAFAAVGAPVFLNGGIGWTGYTRIVDIAFQMDFAQHLADAGRVSPANGGSSYNIVTSKLLGIGYPGGSQATLGSIANVTHTNIAWCYQAFLAFAAAMGALAIYSVLGRITQNRLMRCLGAAVAIQPNILYGYALDAGIKELTTASLLLVVVALLADRLPGTGRRRGVVPLAVAVSGAFGAFSLGLAPWLGLLLAGAFMVSLIRRTGHRYILESWAVFAAVAIVISLPGLITAVKLASVAGAAVGGVVDLGLGNLAAPVSRWASAGVWLTGDYRYPLVHTTASHIFDVIVIGLAVVGVIAAALRRRWSLVVLGVSTPIALDYFIKHSTAWIQLKAFTITAAFAVTLAFAGAAALQGMGRPWRSALGWAAGIVIAGGVLYGNALIYHDTSLAPGARYHDLAAIAARHAGQGPTLDPYFDEYAEYFLRSEKGSTLVDPANFSLAVRPGVPAPPGGQAFAWDLNQLVLSYVEGFPLIIQPRSPAASRAPSNYDLIERSKFFDVWRRDRPTSTVLQHYPLSDLPHERSPALCRVVTAAARRAGPGAEVAYAKNPTAAVVNPVEGTHPDYWKQLGPSALAAYGAGSATMRFTLPSSGRYSIWLQGSLGRPLAFYVDGRRVSSIGYEERYPGQFLLVSGTPLGAGRHELRLVRGGGSLHPGSGDPPVETTPRTIGAIVFSREDLSDSHVYVAPASRVAQICAAPVGYEWLEVLAPGGPPADALRVKL
ncbi:MAG: hypothetical protein JWL67_1548 [Solirubrobacterales bacterium]|nr:hypothetical protein [Solirubrobacterales bacterium]